MLLPLEPAVALGLLPWEPAGGAVAVLAAVSKPARGGAGLLGSPRKIPADWSIARQESSARGRGLLQMLNLDPVSTPVASSSGLPLAKSPLARRQAELDPRRKRRQKSRARLRASPLVVRTVATPVRTGAPRV